MILYIENPIESIRKLLDLISEFSKDAGYKINIQKSSAFLYANNEKAEREIKESISFTIATKRIKYLGISLPKETKELYTENYKTLMKEIKDDKQMKRYSMFLGRKNQYCENDYIPNVIYILNAVPIKLQMAFFTELEGKYSQFIWKNKKN